MQELDPTGRGDGHRPDPAGDGRARAQGRLTASADTWAQRGRVLALAVAVALALSGGLDWLEILLVAAAAVYVAVATRIPSSSLDTVDVGVTIVLLAAGSGAVGPFILFGVVTAASLGARRGLTAGVVVGAALSTLGFAAALVETTAANLWPASAAWLTIFPMSGVMGAQMATVATSPARRDEGMRVLLEANEILASLHRIAEDAPATLSPAGVAEAAIAEIEDETSAAAALVLIERDGLFIEAARSAGRSGEENPILLEWFELEPVTADRSRLVVRSDLPGPIRQQWPGPVNWIVTPLRSSAGSLAGILFVALEDEASPREMRRYLDRLAGEVAVALDNATLFTRVEDLAAMTERRRLADDLHDGVAQELAHVRFELEFLARHGPQDADELRTEAERLARVVHRALRGVRGAIQGLRARAIDEGLVPALDTLLRDLDGFHGPKLTFTSAGNLDLDPHDSEEIFRIVQEAVSNAVRHGRPAHVHVTAAGNDDQIELTIADDGGGIAVNGTNSTGLGLTSMRERAARLGGTLEIDSQEGLGTTVRLRCPRRPVES